MRLIDADEVVKFYKNMGKQFPELSVGVHFAMADIISNLDNIPTVKKEKKMTMTRIKAEFNAQVGAGDYAIQFFTNDYELYKDVEKVAHDCVCKANIYNKFIDERDNNDND